MRAPRARMIVGIKGRHDRQAMIRRLHSATVGRRGEATSKGSTVKRYLSVRQVVEQLNKSVSAKLVYKLIAIGKLRANRATGKILVEEDSLIELMEEKPTPSLPPPPQVTPTREPRRRGRPRREAVELW